MKSMEQEDVHTRYVKQHEPDIFENFKKNKQQ